MKHVFKEMDCFRIVRVSNQLFFGGLTCGFTGCGLGCLGFPEAMADILVMAGFIVLAAGWVLGMQCLICPHCGKPLYEFPRLPSAIPSHCPHCGKKL